MFMMRTTTSERTKRLLYYTDQKQSNSKFSSKVRLKKKLLVCHCLWVYVGDGKGVLNVW